MQAFPTPFRNELRSGRRRNHKAMKKISDSALKRLGYVAGVGRMSVKVPERLREEIFLFLNRVVRRALIYTKHRKQRTVSVADVIEALRHSDIILYGYEGNQ